MLIIDFKKIKKAAETLWIENVVSDIIVSQVENNYQKTKAAASEEGSSIKERLNNHSENLTNSVKGKFGKRVRETIKIEAKKMDEL
ncbi:MAG TPA: hypothetical protein VK119_08675 [Bacillota bacterium]|nr:hypothetical protein [Bacillota bacterium]